MATDSRMAMTGMMIIAAPRVETMSPNPKSFISQSPDSRVTLTVIAKGGGWKLGRPPSIFPVISKEN